MVYWHWNITRDGAIRFSLILLLFSFSYQNFTWLNSHFLPLIPVGYILLGISSVFVLRHIYRTIRWYRVWLNGKRHQKYEKLAIHICLYLVIMSVVLSIPMSIDGKISSANAQNIMSATGADDKYEPEIKHDSEDGYTIDYASTEDTGSTTGPKACITMKFTNTGNEIEEFAINSATLVYENGTQKTTDKITGSSFTLAPNAIHEVNLGFSSIDLSAKPSLSMVIYHCDQGEDIKIITGESLNLDSDTVTLEL